MPKRRSNRNKYILAAILLLAIVIVAAFALSQTKSRRPLASEYFIVTHTLSTGEFSNQNRTFTITTLGLNVTAVGGDATDVYVRCTSQAEPENDYIKNLTKGPPGWDLPVVLSGGAYNFHGLSVRLNDQGMFSANVTVACNEAEAAAITVLMNPEDLVDLSAVP